MMTLLEFCARFRISHKKAKLMLKAGALNVSENANPDAIRIRETLVKGNPLSVVDLCAILETPSLLLELGKFAGKASDQVEPVGNALQEVAPVEIVAGIADAARGDPAAVLELVTWIKRALPVDGAAVSYSWLACRILLASPANIREFDAPRIIRALSRCRKDPEFSGWWTYGVKAGRKTSIYARPMSNALDL